MTGTTETPAAPPTTAETSRREIEAMIEGFGVEFVAAAAAAGAGLLILKIASHPLVDDRKLSDACGKVMDRTNAVVTPEQRKAGTDAALKRFLIGG